MSSITRYSNKSSNNNQFENKVNDQTKKPTIKRTRAPIACFRCHHKKVRCDGARPNCTRCSSTGVLCAYPSSRRARTTHPINIDPFINNLSYLEARIEQMEYDIADQKSMINYILTSSTTNNCQQQNGMISTATEIKLKMSSTETQVQNSRSILAQLRLKSEQRLMRSKKAAAAAKNSTISPKSSKNASFRKLQSKAKSSLQNSHKPTAAITDQITPCDYVLYSNDKDSQSMVHYQNTASDNNADLCSPVGMDWTLFEQDYDVSYQALEQVVVPSQQNDLVINTLFNNNNYSVDGQNFMVSPEILSLQSSASSHVPSLPFSTQQNDMVFYNSQDIHPMTMDDLTSPSRSSSFTSNFENCTFILEPSNSITSITSDMTALSSNISCSSLNSCNNNNNNSILNFSMENIILNSNMTEICQDVNSLPSVWC